MFEYEMNNCVPEYFRAVHEQYEHECALAYARHEHYEANRKKLEDAEKAGYPILKYGGYDACYDCEYADYDTARDDDVIELVICKNPNCPEHQKQSN